MINVNKSPYCAQMVWFQVVHSHDIDTLCLIRGGRLQNIHLRWNSGNCSSSHGDRFISWWTTSGFITKRSKVK